MSSLTAFLRSLAGRIFLVLSTALLVSMLIALTLTLLKRSTDIRNFDMETAVTRVANVVAIMNDTPASKNSLYRSVPEYSGVRVAKASEQGERADNQMARLLASALAGQATVLDVRAAKPEVCVPLRAMNDVSVTPSCWLINLRLRDGYVSRLAINTPLHLLVFRTTLIEPVYVIILMAGLIVAAYYAAIIAVNPLLKLSRAARELSINLDAPPLEESGPRELREAGQAFNLMQDRLKRTLTERMRLLAAITHDLQTPLTRLRLRLDKVEDQELRERLIGDLAATQALISEGLDLAQASHDPSDEPVCLVLESLLESIVDDDADTGRMVTLTGSCQCDVYARPLALRRTISNLIDNAVKYAGKAEIWSEIREGTVIIHVCDRGPGIPEEAIEKLFEPFHRLETSRSRETGGTGLGLTIAKMLAEQNGGRLEIRNRKGGGLDAMICLLVIGLASDRNMPTQRVMMMR